MPSEVGPAQGVPEVSAAVRAGTWIVIAAYQEASAIGAVVRELCVAYPHVVVVDDGSIDGTGQAAREAGATVLTHLINRGQGAALQTGIAFALARGAQFIVTFDADGQHRVRDIAALLTPLVAEQADVSLGSRFLGSGGSVPVGRRLLLGAALVFTWLTSRMRVSDTHNGLRAFTRQAAARIDLQLDRMAHASEILDQIRSQALRHREVPVQIHYTDYSLAKGQRGGAALRVAFDYLVGRVFR